MRACRDNTLLLSAPDQECKSAFPNGPTALLNGPTLSGSEAQRTKQAYPDWKTESGQKGLRRIVQQGHGAFQDAMEAPVGWNERLKECLVSLGSEPAASESH